jgi:hypothetical protein
MDKPVDDKAGWWERAQRSMLTLISLCDAAAKLADAIRRLH